MTGLPELPQRPVNRCAICGDPKPDGLPPGWAWTTRRKVTKFYCPIHADRQWDYRATKIPERVQA